MPRDYQVVIASFVTKSLGRGGQPKQRLKINNAHRSASHFQQVIVGHRRQLTTNDFTRGTDGSSQLGMRPVHNGIMPTNSSNVSDSLELTDRKQRSWISRTKWKHRSESEATTNRCKVLDSL